MKRGVGISFSEETEVAFVMGEPESAFPKGEPEVASC